LSVSHRSLIRYVLNKELTYHIGTVGITTYAATAIGDVTWIEMPELSTQFAAEDTLATIESVKAANEIYAPLSGTVTEVNTKLEEDPKFVNQDAEGEAWIVKLQVESSEEFDGLLDESAYKALVAEAKKEEA
jgi:glycine cleavage system H protein